MRDEGTESCGVSSDPDRRGKRPMIKQRPSRRQMMEER